MGTGELIRKRRKMRSTKASLGGGASLTDSAIEPGSATGRLGRSGERNRIGASRCARIAFRRSWPARGLGAHLRDRRGFGFKAERSAAISSWPSTRRRRAPKLAQALKAWLAQIDSEKSGEITAEQLAEWKAKFGSLASHFQNDAKHF